MKKKRFPFVYLPIIGMLVIGVAGFVLKNSGAAPVNLMQATPSMRPGETATAYASPTATLQNVGTLQAELKDAQEKEYNTRLELIALIEQGAAITAEHERNLVTFGQQTQVANEIELASAQLTATVLPVIATEAQAVRDYQLAQNQFAKEYPAIVREKSEAEAYAKSADKIQAVEIFLQASVAFGIIGLTVIAMALVLRRKPMQVSRVEAAQSIPNLAEIEKPVVKPMFFRDAVNEEKQPIKKRMQLEIPCEEIIFMQMVDGILNCNKSLTFTSWIDTDVYKRLLALRVWMAGEGFAEPVPNHPAELSITADGEQYLRETLENDAPMPPYYCNDKNNKEEKENES